MLDYAALQADAEAEGRGCVVGALIVDARHRVYVHRRGFDRRFLPGCWDVVGGHVEPGETLLEALRREIQEETGWDLAGVPELVHVADWATDEADPTSGRREFDFLVEVDGDLAHPRLERPKHIEWRWIAADDLAILDENRGQDAGLVRRLVELALQYASSAAASRSSRSPS